MSNPRNFEEVLQTAEESSLKQKDEGHVRGGG